ncbi:MAG: hypothetical protein ACK5LY_07320 [Lachnospirales bacterium]
MIDIYELLSASNTENLNTFLEEVKNKSDDESELESKIRVQKALIRYSGLLIENYHNALKTELAKHDIEI